jgi:serine/threonine-protein kinase RsbW/stage II sporulation protein AB (anti-sigma F factor)
MTREQTWTLAAENVAPRLARRAISDFASSSNLPPSVLADVLICVSEAVTNAVQHAYRHAAEPGPVHLQAHINDDLCISVRDDGAGMTPRTDSPGLGIGLPTISNLARSVDIRVDGDAGTEVVMRFPRA